MANLPQSPRVTEIFSAADIFSRLAAVSGAGLVSFSQEPAGAVARTVLDKLRDTVNARDFGAVGGGVIDDYAAIQAALNNSGDGCTVLLSPGTYRLSQGLTIPANRTLQGLSYGFGETYANVLLVGDLAVSPVVTLGHSAGASAAIRALGIGRAAGTIPSGSIGLLVDETRYPVIEDVKIFRHKIGIKTDGALGVQMNRVMTTQIEDTHLYFLDTIQVQSVSVICGRDGAGDYPGDHYIKVEGDSDTLRFSGCQFNTGIDASYVDYAIFFKDYTAANGVISFDSCHFERATNLVGQSGTTNVRRLSFSTCSINTVPGFFNSLPAGFFTELVIADCPFILPAASFNLVAGMTVTGNTFNNTVTLTGGAGVFANNDCDLAVTATGAFTGMVIAGNRFASTFTFAGATGALSRYGNSFITGAGQKLSESRFERLVSRIQASDLVNVVYSASMAIDASEGTIFLIEPDNGTAFTINLPSSPTTGQEIVIRIANITGGALGAATWNGGYKMAAWTQPATGFSRNIRFYYNSISWIELSRTTVDIPN